MIPGSNSSCFDEGMFLFSLIIIVSILLFLGENEARNEFLADPCLAIDVTTDVRSIVRCRSSKLYDFTWIGCIRS